jgi:hypothetical protein
LSVRSVAAIAALIGSGTSAAGVYGGITIGADEPEPAGALPDPDPVGGALSFFEQASANTSATIAAYFILFLLRERLCEALEHTLILERRGVAARGRA